MISQIKYYRKRFMKYAIKNGGTKASLRYKIRIDKETPFSNKINTNR